MRDVHGIQFALRALDMNAYRARAYSKNNSDFRPRFAMSQPMQDLALSWRETS